jgi:aspartate racemase
MRKHAACFSTEIETLKKRSDVNMKTLGLIGGLSWFSTSVYYRTINQLTNDRLGGSNSAKMLLYSVNFSEFKALQDAGSWDRIENMLSDIAHRLETAGAECIIMCTNTPHMVADGVQKRIHIPLLHIAEETAKEIVRQNIDTVGLLGTKFTMEQSFFKDRLARHGIDTRIPSDTDREYLHAAIFNELTKGVFKDETRNAFLDIIERLRTDGAQGVIFGCTEISLLLSQVDCPLPILDTTMIHSKSAVDFALSDEVRQPHG